VSAKSGAAPSAATTAAAASTASAHAASGAGTRQGAGELDAVDQVEALIILEEHAAGDDVHEAARDCDGRLTHSAPTHGWGAPEVRRTDRPDACHGPDAGSAKLLSVGEDGEERDGERGCDEEECETFHR
jgi:hypothetical protein